VLLDICIYLFIYLFVYLLQLMLHYVWVPALSALWFINCYILK